MSLSVAEQIADAVLYEGYVLYPYRASASKNRDRWQVGLVTPRSYAEAAGSDPWLMQTECLAEPLDANAAITVKVRCLQVQERLVEAAVDAQRDEWRATDALMVNGERIVAWEEGIVREFVREGIPLADAPQEWCFPLEFPGGIAHETVDGDSGVTTGRIVRRRQPIAVVVRMATERRQTLVKIRVRIENMSACTATALADRRAAIRCSLAGTHTLLSIEHGAFVSLIDPPPAAVEAVATCVNLHTWPVLVGAQGSRDVMLSSPIILYDYPVVAPESGGDLCDATEIDEMLMLRIRTMTEDEKCEARATDPRARAIVDRADAADAGVLGNLHGAVRRYADAGSSRLTRGSRVRLKPTRRADSMDMFLDGRTATVTEVYRTLEDAPYVAVTLDDDPAGTADPRYRRSLFFHPDELVPIRELAALRGTLVAGIGNVFFGDDGFGVAVAERLAKSEMPPGVRILDAGIKVRDLAYELLDPRYSRAILIDAVRRGGPPGAVYLIDPEAGDNGADTGLPVLDGHTMNLEAVFGLLAALGGTRPRILIVGCEPERIEEGMELSARVSAAVEQAIAVVRGLLEDNAWPEAARTCA